MFCVREKRIVGALPKKTERFVAWLFSGSDCANPDPESFLDGDGLAKTFRGHAQENKKY